MGEKRGAMNYDSCRHFGTHCWIAVSSVCLLLGLSTASIAQGLPALQITSPSSGTVVSPGQTIAVTVTVSPGASVAEMIIIGEDPIGFSQVLTSSPYQFTLQLPTIIRAGSYKLTASATGSLGEDLESAPITVDVEPAGAVTSLRVEPTMIQFSFVGDQMPLRVIGTVQTAIDLTRSSKVTYASQNAAVAVVSTSGLVTAAGGGQTNIVVSASGNQISVPIAVPPPIRGDLNGDGKVDQDDLNIILSALNTPATKPFDARDLNGDGIINALDSRILVTLCTRAGCATH